MPPIPAAGRDAPIHLPVFRFFPPPPLLLLSRLVPGKLPVRRDRAAGQSLCLDSLSTFFSLRSCWPETEEGIPIPLSLFSLLFAEKPTIDRPQFFRSPSALPGPHYLLSSHILFDARTNPSSEAKFFFAVFLERAVKRTPPHTRRNPNDQKTEERLS